MAVELMPACGACLQHMHNQMKGTAVKAFKKVTVILANLQ